MDYIERIKKIKSERKITNEQLSELTGIPLGTLSKILAGISDSPKLVNIVAIADALGCTLDYIVSGVNENTNKGWPHIDEIQSVKAMSDHKQIRRKGDAVGMRLAEQHDKHTGKTAYSRIEQGARETAQSKIIGHEL